MKKPRLQDKAQIALRWISFFYDEKQKHFSSFFKMRVASFLLEFRAFKWEPFII